jgi:thiol-disulfide isomerase/thioredoxin
MKTLRTHIMLSLTSMVFATGALARQKDAPIVTLKGQVVCSQCAAEAMEKGTPYGSEADVQCAIRCAKNGIPSGLAVSGETGATLYVLEKRKSKDEWVNHVGKQVEVSGTVREANQKRYLKVYTIKALSSEPAAGDRLQKEAEALPVAAPELTLKDLTGVEQKLSASRGKIVVLNFWATWCVPCRKEMPALAAIQNEYAAWGVQVIGAAADTVAEQPQVVEFIRKQKINFAIWLGASADDMERFGLGKELPGTVIIDRGGRIVARIRGMVKEEELKRHLSSLIQKQSATLKATAGRPTDNTYRANVPA